MTIPRNTALWSVDIAAYLHGDVAGVCGPALQVLVATAASTAHKGHTGGAEDVLHLPRIFLYHLHQLFDSATEAALPHVLERHH